MKLIFQGMVRQLGKNAIDQRLIEIDLQNEEKTTNYNNKITTHKNINKRNANPP